MDEREGGECGRDTKKMTKTNRINEKVLAGPVWSGLIISAGFCGRGRRRWFVQETAWQSWHRAES